MSHELLAHALAAATSYLAEAMDKAAEDQEHWTMDKLQSAFDLLIAAWSHAEDLSTGGESRWHDAMREAEQSGHDAIAKWHRIEKMVEEDYMESAVASQREALEQELDPYSWCPPRQ